MAPRLKVSDNGRFLTYDSGEPFFYLGDTAWELFHRLDRQEAEHYLRNRADRGYTVIQAVVLAECDGLRDPNPYGHTPLHDNDPAHPNEAYFEHVDWIVNKAEELGLWIGMLPTWGDKWHEGGKGPIVFTPENAAVYGEFVGRRYAGKPIIWVLGGDRKVDTEEQLAIIRATARGLRKGDGGAHLMTLHTTGGHSSSQWFHHDDWCDFHMWQSGHCGRHSANYDLIHRDYRLEPVKPTFDGEPCYEDHPVMNPGWKWSEEDGYFGEHDVRKAAYWALFAGAHGHTYGCHPVWQMYDPDKREVINNARRSWREAIELPGAAQMQHARRLIESRPFLSRIPDQSIVVSSNDTSAGHVQACRDESGAYALIYIPTGKTVSVNTDALSGDKLAVHWYDPRTGSAIATGEVAGTGVTEFAPPGEGPDWVLVLDDASKGFGVPGRGEA